MKIVKIIKWCLEILWKQNNLIIKNLIVSNELLKL